MGDRYQGRSQKQTDVGSDLWWDICCQLHCKYLFICWCWCVYKKVISAYVPFTHICSYLVNELTYFMETICRAWSRHICYRTDMKDLSDGRTYCIHWCVKFFFYCKNDFISYTYYIVCHLVRCLSACLSLLMQFNCVLIFWLWLSHDLIFNILVYF